MNDEKLYNSLSDGESQQDKNPSNHDDLDDDYFFNSDGLVVLTAKYLLERGYCCGNGCQNCPYDYKMVPEPRRTKLLENRKQQDKDAG